MTRSSVLRIAAAAAAVGLVSGVLLLADADPIVASLSYVTLIVLISLLGYGAAATATLLSYLAVTYWFIPPVGELFLEDVDDAALLIAFVVAATASAVTVTHVNALRQRAETHERAAFDARVDAAVNENRAAFLSAMTHSLRTPLASIKATATALREPESSLPPDRRDELLAIASDEADRLDLLVTKVLELSRVRAGRLVAHREPTDIVELARDAARRLRHLAERQHVHVKVVGDVVIANVDPQMTEVVLLSLVENALEYAPRETDVVVEVCVDPGEGCRIRVIDHGAGIVPADRERVFEEFVQVDRSKGSGSGIGLALVAAFTSAHDGRAEATETPGGGATFSVTLGGTISGTVSGTATL